MCEWYCTPCTDSRKPVRPHTTDICAMDEKIRATIYQIALGSDLIDFVHTNETVLGDANCISLFRRPPLLFQRVAERFQIFLCLFRQAIKFYASDCGLQRVQMHQTHLRV